MIKRLLAIIAILGLTASAALGQTVITRQPAGWRWNNNGGVVYLRNETDSVGIGTSSPSSRLEVVGVITATSFTGDGANLTNVTAAAAESVHWDNVTNKPAGLDTDSSDDLTTATVFGGDISGTYGAIAVGNDTHLHAYANITGKPANIDEDSTDDQPLNDTLTELTKLTDPGANRLPFWNDTSNDFEFLDYSAWDTNSSNDFDGSYASLTDVPANIDEDSTDDITVGGSAASLTNIPLANGTGALALPAQAGNATAGWYVTNNGNVGIGTTAPGADLQVVGSAAFGDGTNNAVFDADGDLNFGGTSDYLVDGNSFAFRYASDEDAGLKFNDTSGHYSFTNTTGAEVAKIAAAGGHHQFISGNVGIGTTAPAQALDVAGAITFTGTGDTVKIGHLAGGNDDASNNRNVFVGREAGEACTSCDNSVAIGSQSGEQVTTGSRNIIIGTDAGRYITTGQYNTFIGHAAGRGVSITDGSYNTGIGYAALRNGLVNGTLYNTVIGYGADVADSGITNSIAIGRDANATKHGIAAIGNPDYINETWLVGNVGIGTTNPNAQLQVAGTINATAINVGGSAVLTAESDPGVTTHESTYDHDSYDSHLANTTIHVTAANKTAWDSKIDGTSLDASNLDAGTIPLARYGTDSITEEKLNIANPPSNGKRLTWNGTAASMEWMTGGSGDSLWENVTGGIAPIYDGNVSIGTTAPVARLHIVPESTDPNETVYVAYPGAPVIFTSPDGSCSACSVNNADVFSCSGVVCPGVTVETSIYFNGVPVQFNGVDLNFIGG